MRIIAGKHKGRILASLDDKEVRPTKGMIREALFNILVSGRFLIDNNSKSKQERIYFLVNPESFVFFHLDL